MSIINELRMMLLSIEEVLRDAGVNMNELHNDVCESVLTEISESSSHAPSCEQLNGDIDIINAYIILYKNLLTSTSILEMLIDAGFAKYTNETPSEESAWELIGEKKPIEKVMISMPIFSLN